MKKLLTGLMAVVMMAGLAGCGSKDDGAGEGSDTAKKELTVYTNSGYKPYEMVDEKGNLYGFDIDVMNEAAKLAASLWPALFSVHFQSDSRLSSFHSSYPSHPFIMSINIRSIFSLVFLVSSAITLFPILR